MSEATVTATGEGTPTLPLIRPQISVETFHGQGTYDTWNVFLVGAGGTGARVGTLLPKILRSGDRVTVIDPDHVEERNLLRQHFIPSDVGKSKAMVTASRIQRGLPTGVDVEVNFLTESFNVGHVTSSLHVGRFTTVILGCVDNVAARMIMASIATSSRVLPNAYPVIWLDAGNGLRLGQVVLTWKDCPVLYGPAGMKDRLLEVGLPETSGTYLRIMRRSTTMINPEPREESVLRSSYNGMAFHAPELIDKAAAAEEAAAAPDCGIRLDTQSTAANQMAATTMGTVLAAIRDELPIIAPFYQFSTDPCMITSTPFDRNRMKFEDLERTGMTRVTWS